MSKETMKLALEALEYIEHNYMSLPAPAEKAITALREALAEQPAPVAKPHEQEPVAWIVEDQIGERLEWASDAHSCHGVPTFPLYTSPPPQRTWVGLTDEEIDDTYEAIKQQGWAINYARAIEARLREKNSIKEKNT